ncbi:ABC-type Fe3+ transport system substrate-binding protein [Psychromicrobium silvestre]|uniref:ABC-type Fe3+ transport system substrate-binding protein n=1 Tax=Psychromicrobium silvestre TaxID=1645614 RepID=A0A7Y9LV91_9MICC|nr:ABC transporter substrate-binding protein [Psychromicrobium silvestre]NYE96265.1 ABC-type Fe3+ transport system substrate-binding protein [Psychromicrobium silvestre]
MRHRSKRFSIPAAAGLAALVMLLAACGQGGASGSASTPAATLGAAAANTQQLGNETDELQKLYQDAIAEGGKLTVWAGGDAPNQQEALQKAFQQRFPQVPIDIVVNLSKDHDVEIDKQLKEGKLTPDVAMLQTSQDFERWKAEGELTNFKPAGFDHQLPGYADPDGAFLTANIFSFLPEYAKQGLSSKPTSYQDFLKPEFKGKLVLTPPHDDDAVLYVYDKIIKKYGVDFLTKLAAQKPSFVRGTAAPAAMVGTGNYLGNLTGYATAPSQPAVSFIPTEDPFITWTQRAALFNKAQHPAAGKLFLAFVASKEYQSAGAMWPTRDDVAVGADLKPLSEYKNTSPADFLSFMRDRQHIDQLKAQMEKVFGPVKGESPLTDPALLKIVGAS